MYQLNAPEAYSAKIEALLSSHSIVTDPQSTKNTLKTILDHIKSKNPEIDAYKVELGNKDASTVIYKAPGSPASHVGLSGWVNAEYVECPCSREDYYANSPSLTYASAVTVKGQVHLRETPSKTSTSLATLGANEQVDVLSEYTGADQALWYRVRAGEKMGFIRSDMLRIVQ
ncbi:MAG: SH3 domain-containing protein, partial [Clostridia bacterium]|nr:SH3 domain-containing protein [Clostridia bacterium]